jgi:hypothetical protein
LIKKKSFFINRINPQRFCKQRKYAGFFHIMTLMRIMFQTVSASQQQEVLTEIHPVAMGFNISKLHRKFSETLLEDSCSKNSLHNG